MSAPQIVNGVLTSFDAESDQTVIINGVLFNLESSSSGLEEASGGLNDMGTSTRL